MNLKKALELRKTKYIKRTGSPGHYKYIYKESEIKKKRKDTSKMTMKELEEEYKKEINNLERYSRMPNTNHKVALVAITANRLDTVRHYLDKFRYSKMKEN